LTVLLTLYDTCVPSQIAERLKGSPVFRIQLEESTSDTETHSTCLTSVSTTVDSDVRVELVNILCHDQRLQHVSAKSIPGKVDLERSLIYDDLTGARTKENTGNRVLSAAGSIVLNKFFSHLMCPA
jgi:hypothetical protein